MLSHNHDRTRELYRQVRTPRSLYAEHMAAAHLEVVQVDFS